MKKKMDSSKKNFELFPSLSTQQNEKVTVTIKRTTFSKKKNSKNSFDSPVSYSFFSGNKTHFLINEGKPEKNNHPSFLSQNLDKIIDFTLTFLIALMVGFISAVAIMLILPTMGLVPFLIIFTCFTLVGSRTEGAVYHRYIKNFIQNRVQLSDWSELELYILRRDLGEKFHLSSRRTKKRVLKKHHLEIQIKNTLGYLSILPAILAGIHFTGLSFSHLLTFTLLIGLANTPLLVIGACILSFLIGSIFALIIFRMLEQAIIYDAHKKIYATLLSLFTHDRWHQLYFYQKCQHVLLGIVKGFVLLMILAIAIAATLYSQSEWLESTITLFQTAFHLSSALASKLALALTLVMLVINFWFTMENSLISVKLLFDARYQTIKSHLAKWCDSPKNFFLGIANWLAFFIHVGGVGAIAVQGAAANTSGSSQIIHKILASTLNVSSEILTDIHPIIEEDEDEHANHHDFFSHFFGEHHHDHTTSNVSHKYKEPEALFIRNSYSPNFFGDEHNDEEANLAL